ncbi:MAG: cyclic nucleotide-binding domain-containing protein [Spirochaetia bacterium]|jgi:response regulator RpfG family c-di-GMP phosphodiesterase|nr:cyclic nucleotide-binding domain-containing protein [Spirochaetia bacterium]
MVREKNLSGEFINVYCGIYVVKYHEKIEWRINSMEYNLNVVLKNSELFSNLNEASISLITSHFKKITFNPGQVICREGDIGDSMFVILSGKVSVLRDMGWGERELGKMESPEIFGEMALITEETRSATVKALEKTECLQLDSRSFDTLLDQDLSFAQQVAKFMTRRCSALTKKTSDELLSAYRALMFAIADLTDSRDPETGAHLERTRNYCLVLSDLLSRHSRFKNVITPGFLDSIYHVSPLHDVGKVAVPDAILLKPARLTPDEYDIMKRHTSAGAEAFDKVLEQCDNELFRMARRICLHHHEKWDGTGYPAKLSGEAIPLEARIMAFADVYDALCSKRVYKPAMSKEETRAEIKKSSGTFFDPLITQIMLENIKLFEDIHDKYKE